MRTFSKLALAASIAVAATFTMISCSAEDIADIFDDPSSSSVKQSSSSQAVEENSMLDRAFRFMRYKFFGVNDNDYAHNIFRRWDEYMGYDSWDGYNSDSPLFDDEYDYDNAGSDFYEIRNESWGNSQKLSEIADYYTINMKETGKILSSSLFNNFGVKDLMKIMLMTHDEIYSKDDRSVILVSIYSFMDSSCDFYYLSNCYDGLEKYMSDEILDEIHTVNSKMLGADDYDDMRMAVWVYSFWARRHLDATDDAVYSFLKKVEAIY